MEIDDPAPVAGTDIATTFPHYRNLSNDLKFRILKAYTEEDVMDYLLLPNIGKKLAALSRPNFRPRIHDLIGLHFREEALIFPLEMALARLNNYADADVQACNEIQDYVFDPVTGQITSATRTQPFQHLFYLSSMSQRANDVLDTVLEWTLTPDFTRADYYSLLRVWRMCGTQRSHRAHLQSRFDFFGSLRVGQRMHMNGLLNRIAGAYASSHADADTPELIFGPGEGELVCEGDGNGNDAGAPGHIHGTPFRSAAELAGSGLYSVAIKHWLLSASHEGWVSFFVGETPQHANIQWGRGWRLWEVELNFGHRLDYESADPEQPETSDVICRAGRSQKRDDGSMFHFVLTNRCAAFEHAIRLGIGQSLMVGPPDGPDRLPRPADGRAGQYVWRRSTNVVDRGNQW
ncbi:hypothetical protein MBLNU459_g4806t1 [Dothideomycetes sp. NU459]